MEHTPKDSEVGCSINLVTGEHYGPCKGSCGPETEPEALARFMGCTDEEAKIMLAAPALLSALKDMVRIHPSGDERDMCVGTECLCQKARAAILAAKGD